MNHTLQYLVDNGYPIPKLYETMYYANDMGLKEFLYVPDSMDSGYMFIRLQEPELTMTITSRLYLHTSTQRAFICQVLFDCEFHTYPDKSINGAGIRSLKYRLGHIALNQLFGEYLTTLIGPTWRFSLGIAPRHLKSIHRQFKKKNRTLPFWFNKQIPKAILSRNEQSYVMSVMA